MLTTRIRPKISVKPLATTKKSAASVSPLSVTTANLRGSSAALTSSQITTTTRDRGQRHALWRPAARPRRQFGLGGRAGWAGGREQIGGWRLTVAV